MSNRRRFLLMKEEAQSDLSLIHSFPLSYNGNLNDVGSVGTGIITPVNGLTWDSVRGMYLANSGTANSPASILSGLQLPVTVGSAYNNITIEFIAEVATYNSTRIGLICGQASSSNASTIISAFATAAANTDGITMPIGSLKKVVITLESNARRMYLDGELVRTIPSGVTVPAMGVTNMFIGWASSSTYIGTFYIKGLKIYNRILTDEEIANL